MYSDRTLTALAWCCLRQDYRMFRLERMQAVKRGSQSFRPRRVAMLRDYLARLEARAASRADASRDQASIRTFPPPKQ
jgi:predicted DNA-binding transcriptional regulator YafY